MLSELLPKFLLHIARTVHEKALRDRVYQKRHIGVVSDRRNKNGVPYVIHHNDPMADSLRAGYFGRENGHRRTLPHF